MCPRQARRSPDVVVVHRAELAGAGRASHRRVAPRQHHARRHEDDCFRSFEVRETGKVIRERIECVARAASLVRIVRLLRRLTRDRRENLQHALVIFRRLDQHAAIGHGHEPDPVARRQAGDELGGGTSGLLRDVRADRIGFENDDEPYRPEASSAFVPKGGGSSVAGTCGRAGEPTSPSRTNWKERMSRGRPSTLA